MLAVNECENQNSQNVFDAMPLEEILDRVTQFCGNGAVPEEVLRDRRQKARHMGFRGWDHIRLLDLQICTGFQDHFLLATMSRIIGQDLLRAHFCGNQSGTSSASVRKPEGTHGRC